MTDAHYPITPDGRYFVARGRLWRRSDPSLTETERATQVRELMAARRAVRDAADDTRIRAARQRVQAAKVALGERGPVWWTDGAPDESRRHPANSHYAQWWAALDAATRDAGMR